MENNKETLELAEQLRKAFDEKPTEIEAKTKNDKELDSGDDYYDNDNDDMEKAVTKLSKKFTEEDEDIEDEDMERYLKKCSYSKAIAKKAIKMFKEGKLKKALREVTPYLFNNENNEEYIEVTEEFSKMVKSFPEIQDENKALKAEVIEIKKGMDKIISVIKLQNKGIALIIDSSDKIQKSMSTTPIMKGFTSTPIEKSFENNNNSDANIDNFASIIEIKKAFGDIAQQDSNYLKPYQLFLAGDYQKILLVKDQIEKIVGKKIKL